MTVALLILTVAIIIVAGVALHAMAGVQDNNRAILHLQNREGHRWRGQNAVNNMVAMDIGRLKAKTDVLEGRTGVSDGK
jgi:hypothetical protein